MRGRRKIGVAVVHRNCAGIDPGTARHCVAVPECADERPVRSSASFTDELHAMAAWLKSCGVDIVAMEATGVYGIPVFEVLDPCGVWRCIWSMRGRPGRSAGAKAMCSIVSGFVS